VTIIFFFQAEDGIRDFHVTGVQTCALPISRQGGDGGSAHGHLPLSSLTLGLRAPLAKKRPADAVQGLRPPRPCCKHRRPASSPRSEERRVGKERRCWSWPCQSDENT